MTLVLEATRFQLEVITSYYNQPMPCTAGNSWWPLRVCISVSNHDCQLQSLNVCQCTGHVVASGCYIWTTCKHISTMWSAKTGNPPHMWCMSNLVAVVQLELLACICIWYTYKNTVEGFIGLSSSDYSCSCRHWTYILSKCQLAAAASVVQTFKFCQHQPCTCWMH